MPPIRIDQDELNQMADVLTGCVLNVRQASQSIEHYFVDLYARGQQRTDGPSVDSEVISAILRRCSGALGNALMAMAEVMDTCINAVGMASAEVALEDDERLPDTSFRFFGAPSSDAAFILSPEARARYSAFLKANAPR